MQNRLQVLQQVDELLERFGPFDNDDAREMLRQGLNVVFRPVTALQDPPWVAFHAIYPGQDGRLAAVVESLTVQNNLEGWCRSVEHYLGGRLRIEPEVKTPQRLAGSASAQL